MVVAVAKATWQLAVAVVPSGRLDAFEKIPGSADALTRTGAWAEFRKRDVWLLASVVTAQRVIPMLHCLVNTAASDGLSGSEESAGTTVQLSSFGPVSAEQRLLFLAAVDVALRFASAADRRLDAAVFVEDGNAMAVREGAGGTAQPRLTSSTRPVPHARWLLVTTPDGKGGPRGAFIRQASIGPSGIEMFPLFAQAFTPFP